ncbi:MAG: VanZ family protein [Sterolibacteriaceae bacterium]|uniref:VanZ family protein n=1 Tax=Candidatus Methylophosphatis roskildensis TaxID=2899263 RepID=A0A9D7E1M8_9PROT|nr:VanZ family protein [Candidatus Methylophosphatis roskildensis]MBK7235039.1 VanZ family protein [Sterolibacteriaceae bacterium]
MAERDAYRLARTLALVYALLIIYASLHPLAGWRIAGTPMLDFLGAPWPRYFTRFDLMVNVSAYLPLGFLLVPALETRLKRGWAVLASFALGAALSFAMEVLQGLLPTRVPSNVDWGCNMTGTLLGALAGARWGRIFADRGWLSRWRRRRIVRGRRGDFGLILMGAWLLTQLSPEGVFLGTGDLRSLLALPTPLDYSARGFLVIEMAIAACGVLAAGSIAWQNLREPSPWLLGLLITLVIGARSLSAALYTGEDGALHWLTPGNLYGLAIGTMGLILAVRLPDWSQRILAGSALLAATALANLLPENPYARTALNAWNAGQFLNFNGLTRLISLLWPFAALAFLMTASSSRPIRPAH